MNNGLIDDTFVKEPELYSSPTLPSGTLTFLFTDIEGSTRIWEQHSEQMRAAMRRHDELIESTVVKQSGMVVRPRGEGDSRFAVFTRATDALRAAIDIQQLLSAEPWMIPVLRVRLALYSGEADLRDGDYYGSAVNRCARLRNAAHGGQILLSQTTYCLVRDELPPGVSLRDLGEHHLNGLQRPEHVYQVIADRLPSEFPPLKTSETVRNNLPVVLTSFIGRERDQEEVVRLVSQTRLLTITGFGGAGKTRLVLKVAENLLDSYPDGVWFIDLSPLSNPAVIPQYMLNVLGIREEAGNSPVQTMVDTQKDKKELLILDNCEHLLPEVAQLAETILRGAPGLKMMATSREKMGVPGEINWRIPPLSSPGIGEEGVIENLIKYESVNLFLDRAVAARPDFVISQENVDAIAQICVRLDGIPLAIELAAARVRVLSVEEIAGRLDDRFRLLVGNHTTLPRHQTLRALMDWSYDLLTEKERILFRRLSVFAGGWTLKTAEEVCSGPDIEAWEVLDLLTGLIDKSFVIGDTRNGHQRYHFLETILKFSQERLLESEETDKFTHRHAEYFLKVAAESYGKMWGNDQAYWLKRLDEERDNLRRTLGHLSHVARDQEFLQMAGSLWRYWEIRGSFTEGRAWLETALMKNLNAPDFLRANGLGGSGHLARQQGDYVQAQMLHDQSLALFRALGDKLNTARQLNALGEIARYLGDYDRSEQLHKESLSIRHEIGDKEGVAVSLRQLGVIARDRGQYRHARELLEDSLKLEHELGDKLLEALSLNDLGLVEYCLCNYGGAESLFRQAISIQRELNDRLGISNSLQNLGNAAKVQGDFKQAGILYQECLALKKELGDKRGISQVTSSLAEVAFQQGKYPMAADLARQSLSLSQELGLKRGVLASLELLGFVAYFQGNYERSSSLAQETMALSTEMNAPRASGYAKVLLALGKYAEGNLGKAREIFQQALVIFKKLNDRRNTSYTYVNLARTAYRQGDHNAARHFLEESLSTSKKLNTRWNLALVLEIMGLLQRSEGNYKLSLELFRESLVLSVAQENQQGIANCLGALAGLAVMANQPGRAARLFAAAARLRREMGAKMSSNDRLEYEHYLTMVHKHLDHAAFEVEWSEGFLMETGQFIKELREWLENF
jgi:predicted ATPase/class 3 adenylate cyclase